MSLPALARAGARLALPVALFAVAAPRAGAQDCHATTPLLGRPFAAAARGASVQGGERRAGGSLTAHVAGPLHLTAEYAQGRFDAHDDVLHEGRLEGAAAFGVAGVDLCPNVGVGAGRLATEDHGAAGEERLLEARLGVAVGRAFAVGRTLRLAPFVDLGVVRHSATWRPDAHPDDEESERETFVEAPFGVTLSAGPIALVARHRPSVDHRPAVTSLAAVYAFGRRHDAGHAGKH